MRRKYFPPKDPTIPDVLARRELRVPKAWIEPIQLHMREKSITFGVAVLRALRNEMLTKTPFEHPIPEPSTPYDPENHSPYAARLYDFIRQHSGFSKEYLVLLATDAGIPTGKHVVEALRDLMESGMIEAYMPVDALGLPKSHACYRIPKDRKRSARRERVADIVAKIDDESGVL